MQTLARRARGFTLIELLVVIAIIGLLSSIVLASLNTARSRARDATRNSDMHQLRTALELFYSAKGRYPSAADGNCAYNTSFVAGGCMNALVTGGYIRVLPKDPKTGGTYSYDNWCRVGGVVNGTSDRQFRMWVATENPNNGLQNNWWSNNYAGQTTCTDPS